MRSTVTVPLRAPASENSTIVTFLGPSGDAAWARAGPDLPTDQVSPRTAPPQPVRNDRRPIPCDALTLASLLSPSRVCPETIRVDGRRRAGRPDRSHEQLDGCMSGPGLVACSHEVAYELLDRRDRAHHPAAGAAIPGLTGP